MSSKDRTRQKLVGSMRKTKAVAGIGADSGDRGSAAASSDEVQQAKPAADEERHAASASQPDGGRADNYQSGRRVWPD